MGECDIIVSMTAAGNNMQTVRYNYRLYPTKTQEAVLNRLFGCCRVVYNDTIDFFNNNFNPNNQSKLPTAANASKQILTNAKKTTKRAFLKEVSSVALQQEFRNAWLACWHGVSHSSKQKPAKRKTKKHNPVNSANFTSNGFSINQHGVYISKIGVIKTKWSRPMPSEPTSCTISHARNGRWYVSFVVKRPKTPFAQCDNNAGIDMGLTDMATIVNTKGKRWKIENPRNYAKIQDKIGRLQRHLSKQTKGSKRYERTRHQIALLYSKAHDALSDYQWKNVLNIIRETQAIGVETLDIKSMTVKHGKSVRDAAMRSFLMKLGSKADEHCRVIIQLNQWLATTKVCALCKHKLKVGLPEYARHWVCPNCGAHLDRDYNAALNILDAAGLAGSLNARGGSVRSFLASAENGCSRGTAYHPNF